MIVNSKKRISMDASHANPSVPAVGVLVYHLLSRRGDNRCLLACKYPEMKREHCIENRHPRRKMSRKSMTNSSRTKSML